MPRKKMIGLAAGAALFAALLGVAAAPAQAAAAGWYFDASHPQVTGGRPRTFGVYPSRDYALTVWSAFGKTGGWTLVRAPYQVGAVPPPPARTYVLTYYQLTYDLRRRQWQWAPQGTERSTNLPYLQRQKAWWEGCGKSRYQATIN
jgi:hypothetical protein